MPSDLFVKTTGFHSEYIRVFGLLDLTRRTRRGDLGSFTATHVRNWDNFPPTVDLWCYDGSHAQEDGRD